MVKYWNFYKKTVNDYVLFDGYKCENGGSAFYLEILDTLKQSLFIRIFFPRLVECMRFYHPDTDAVTETDWIGELMELSGTQPPCNPFFILDDSELIDKVKEIESIVVGEKKYLHYVMMTEGMWIDIVSSEPPQITKVDHRSSSMFI